MKRNENTLKVRVL